MVKMTKMTIFPTFFNFDKNIARLNFFIKLHPYIHCHIYALMNETRQDKSSITKGVP